MPAASEKRGRKLRDLLSLVARALRPARRGLRRSEIELHFRRRFGSFLRRKIGFRLKAEHPGQENRGKRFYGGVVPLHRLVEFLTFDRDPVFGSFELRLQVTKIARRGPAPFEIPRTWPDHPGPCWDQAGFGQRKRAPR